MKKFCFLFVFIFCCFILQSSSFVIANADQQEYCRVITDNVMLYADQQAQSPLFILPKSYFCKVLSKNDQMVQVECYGNGNTPAVDGYLKADLVIEYDQVPTDPFLTFYLTTTTHTTLYSDADCTQKIQVVFADRQLNYYGSYLNDWGERLFFVHYNNKYGYVKEVDVAPFTLPLHPLPIIPENTQATQQDGQNSNATALIRTAIIICVSVAGFLAIIVVYKRKSDNPTQIQALPERDYE